MTERGVTNPFRTSDCSVAKFIPGAAGLRVCNTYHGPMRCFVACRVAGVSSSVQRGHGLPRSALIEPQNGQTCCGKGGGVVAVAAAADRALASCGELEVVR